VDKIINQPKTGDKTKEMEMETCYCFRLPNYEVSSSYKNDCFRTIFDLASDEDLETKSQELKQAFLTRDPQTVSTIFNGFLSTVTYLQRTKDEKTFHSYVQIILSVLGFKTYSELLKAARRLDLCLELPEKIFVIIELKYCSEPAKLNKKEENQALAAAAEKFLPELLDKTLSLAVQDKLKFSGVTKLLSQLSKKPSTDAELDQVLAQASAEVLSEEERTKALAVSAKKTLPKEKLEQALMDAGAGKDISKKQIYAILSDAANLP
jgi:hypothetical protein